MNDILDYPYVLLAVAIAVQWLTANAAAFVRSRHSTLTEEQREEFETLETATLTLLALLIGFSFQMSIGRYDLRKAYEEAEANAIGTEYVRADLLPAEAGSQVRKLLTSYAEQRILFYTIRDPAQLAQINAATARLQAELWSTVTHSAALQPSPIAALAVAGMNDVLNSQGYTQAAWWNRIPVAAWWLMWLIAICANVIHAYRERKTHPHLLLVLPVIVSIAMFLIAELDSPRTGLVRVLPQNLISLSQSLPAAQSPGP